MFSCGTCIFCRKRRAAELAVRCVLHSSLYPRNCFLTLTYDEAREDYFNELDYSHIQKFKKRLRRHCDYHLAKKIEIFNVHEYGRHGKKHWHLIVFNHDFDDKKLKFTKNGNPLYTSEKLLELWSYGIHTIGSVTEASAMYQAQYTQKDLKNGNNNNKKKAHSKHSGIGRDYFLKHYRQILTLGYIPFGNRKAPVPRYFQKIAHKHYSHFYCPSNFFDTPDRKRLYTPFRKGEQNKDIADLFITFRTIKEEFVCNISEEWDNFISQNLFKTELADFQKSAANYLYDFNNKQNLKEF